MALGLYKRLTGSTYALYSSDDSGDSPISTTHDGRTAGTTVIELFLRNNDPDVYYSSITLRCVQEDAGTEQLDGDTWGVKLKYSVSEPTLPEWDLVDFNNTISLPNIGTSVLGDATTYLPIWYLIQHPGQIEANIEEGVKLRVEAIEGAVV